MTPAEQLLLFPPVKPDWQTCDHSEFVTMACVPAGILVFPL